MADQSQKAPGIFTDVLTELRKTLAGCAAFASHKALRAIFVDARLHLWQQRLPEEQTVEERINQVIDLLHHANNEQGQNALVLLLQVVEESEPTKRAALIQLRHALQHGLRGDSPRLLHPGTTPYPGLRPFQPTDAPFFFGRDTLITHLVQKVKGGNFLAVLGPAGSGKSSLVLAGLLPVLQQSYLSGGKRWRHLVIKPGRHPLATLASSLTPILEGHLLDETTLCRTLVSDEQALRLVADLLKGKVADPLILVVDQAETLWTQIPSEPEEREVYLRDQQAPFIRLLLAAAAVPESPFLVILTLRTEFLHRTAEYPGLARWIEGHNVIVGSMQSGEVREAIEKPAALVGGRFEPGLVDRLIGEAGAEPGTLPLLAYTLLELWKAARDTGSLMTWEAFRKVGGVKGALGIRADAILGQYTEQERHDLRQLLVQLVQYGEGVEHARRRVLLVDIVPSGGNKEQVHRLLKPLVDERLLTIEIEASSKGESVEVSHEALFREWGTLKTWIEEARTDSQLRRHLEDAANRWESNPQDSFLWRGPRLGNVESWLSRVHPSLSEHEQRFLDASRAREEEGLQTERNRTASAKLAAIAMSSLVVLAFCLAAVAWNRQTNVDSRIRDVQARSALSELSQGNEEQALLLTLAAVYGTSSLSPTVSRALLPVLEKTQIRFRLRDHKDAIIGVAWSPDGQYLATGSRDNTVRLWEATTGKLLHTFTDDYGSLISITWSPDSKHVLVGSGNKTARIWEAASGQPLYTLSGHLEGVTSVAWSPNGQYVLTGSSDKTARIWYATGGQLLYTLSGHLEGVTSVAWSPNGQYVLTGSSDKTARIWNATSGQPLHTLDDLPDAIFSVRWSPDGRYVLATSHGKGPMLRIWDARSSQLLDILVRDSTRNGAPHWISLAAWSPDGAYLLTDDPGNTARIWNATSGQPLYTLTGHSAPIASVVWSPDGQLILTGSLDNTARIWDARSGQLLHTLTGHSDGIVSAAWSPDGTHVLTASEDHSVRLWNVKTPEIPHTQVSKVDQGNRSPDGRYILTWNDNIARIWDARSGQLLHTLTGHSDGIVSIAWSPDGKYILSGGSDHTARLWDATRGQLLHTLTGHSGLVSLLAWSPAGDRVLTGGSDTSARIWHAETGQLLHSLIDPANGIGSVAWSPDGQSVLSLSSDLETVHIWHAETGQLLQRLTGPSNGIGSVAWSPDGQSVLVASREDTYLWNARSGQLLHTLTGHSDGVSSAAWSPDGQSVLTGGFDNTARIWDARNGQLLHTLTGHSDGIVSVAWSPDGQLILTGSLDNTARIWDARSGQLLHTLTGHSDGFTSFLWSSNGAYVFAWDQTNTVHTWVIDENLLIARFMERTCDVLSDEEIRAEIPDWQGCELELVGVTEALAMYHELGGD